MNEVSLMRAATEREANRGDKAVAEAHNLRTELTRLQMREDALRRLHREREWRPLDGTYLGGTVCNHDRHPWPCATITILDGKNA